MKNLEIVGLAFLASVFALKVAAAPVWISAADARSATKEEKRAELAPVGTSLFAKEVVNAQRVVKAVWTASGLGVFNIFVNGAKIGQEVLKPGFTHARKTKYTYTYDVTAQLKTAAGATNAFTAEVSTGWWNDKVSGYLGQKSAFWASLVLTYADGTTQMIETDTTWLAGVGGPVVRAGIFDGEIYDARICKTSAAMKPAVVNTEFAGEILPANGASIVARDDLTLSPVEAYTWKGVTGADANCHGTVVKTRLFKAGEAMTLVPGETLVIDFGQNAAAVPELEATAAAGTKVTILTAEMLNDQNGAKKRGNDGPEGAVYRVNLRSIHTQGSRVEYTFAGKGLEKYRPEYTFCGYRYISVTATDKVTFKALRSVPITSIRKDLERGSVTTGVADVNRLIKNVWWGQYSNYLSVPTDCPQRNERQGWTADTQVFVKAGIYNADTYDFFVKFMRDMADTQTECGSYTGVAPVGEYGNAGDKRLGWSDCGIVVPFVTWQQTGRTDILAKYWGSMTTFMNFLKENRYAKDSALNYQWADWLSYEDYESNSGRGWTKGPDGKRLLRPETSLYWKYLGGCYWLMDAEMMSQMAAALGKTDEAARYAKMVEEARQYIRTELLENGRIPACLRGMQTPALFALRCKLLADPKEVEATKAALLKNIADHGNCLQTGFLGTSILMDTLTYEVGRPDVAYTLLLQHKNPSWLYSVDQGATTIWERWNSYTKKDGFGPVGMNSFNHYAYGAVLAWIYGTAAGIQVDPKLPGFRHFVLAPIPDKRLGKIDAAYRTPYGVVKSAWNYAGDGTCTWTYTIPTGTTATVVLPNGTRTEKGAGTYTDKL